MSDFSGGIFPFPPDRFPQSRRIRNGVIDNIQRSGPNYFVTISYRKQGDFNRTFTENLVLIVSQTTIIISLTGQRGGPGNLRVGMRVDVTFSARMTMSLPPQAVAYLIIYNPNVIPVPPWPIPGPGPRPPFPPGPGPRPNPPGPGPRPRRPFPLEPGPVILPHNVTTSQIIWTAPQNSFLLAGQSDNAQSQRRFNVLSNTQILDQHGRSIRLQDLPYGVTVRIEHDAFLPGSTPPQANAIKIEIV